jgi:ankyrin repeat protein
MNNRISYIPEELKYKILLQYPSQMMSKFLIISKTSSLEDPNYIWYCWFVQEFKINVPYQKIINYSLRYQNLNIFVNIVRNSGLDDINEFLFTADTPDQIDWLLINGADVNYESYKYIVTPIFHVINNNRADLATIILKHKPDLNKVNSFGESPISIAIRVKCFLIELLLIEHGATLDKELVQHVLKGDLMRARFCIKSGANINITVNGQYLIDIAKDNHDDKMIQLLENARNIRF